MVSIRKIRQRAKLRRPKHHPCWYPWHGYDHDLAFKCETIGDYGVINGTYQEMYYECSVCGHQEAGEPPCYDEFDVVEFDSYAQLD